MRVVHEEHRLKQGPREVMQDALRVGPVPSPSFVFGVFDGHNPMGAYVAQNSAKIVDQMIVDRQYPMTHGKRKKYLRGLIDAKQKELFEDRGYPDKVLDHSGSTASIGVLQNDTLTVANVGDSTVMFYPDDSEALEFTTPHDLTNAAEIRRVGWMGYGTLEHRFGNKSPLVLGVSRAIGDVNIPFVSHKADVRTKTLPGSGFLVAATDGVWGTDLVTEEGLKFKGYKAEIEKIVRATPIHRKAMEELVLHLTVAYGLKNEDNTAAIVARIQ